MKKAITNVTTWLNEFTDLLKALIVFGIVSGILYDDYFGVIGGIGRLMNNMNQGGLAGLVALVLVVTWWKKNSLKNRRNIKKLLRELFYFKSAVTVINPFLKTHLVIILFVINIKLTFCIFHK